MEDWLEGLHVFEKRYGLEKTDENECFVKYSYQKMEVQWSDLLKAEKIWSVNFEKDYKDIDKYDFEVKCLQPIKVNEEHEFHTHLNDRCNKECSLYGFLSIIDWVVFFIEISRLEKISLFGLRALKYIISKYGNPFNELRQRIYGFNNLKGSYIMPTQIECCLQLCLIELDLHKDVKSVRISMSKKHYEVFEHRIINASQMSRIINDDIVSFEISLRNVYLGYFKYLLPWPTY